jgi:hypothetical protein
LCLLPDLKFQTLCLPHKMHYHPLKWNHRSRKLMEVCLSLRSVAWCIGYRWIWIDTNLVWIFPSLPKIFQGPVTKVESNHHQKCCLKKFKLLNSQLHHFRINLLRAHTGHQQRNPPNSSVKAIIPLTVPGGSPNV